jgi:hypothetical protein
MTFRCCPLDQGNELKLSLDFEDASVVAGSSKCFGFQITSLSFSERNVIQSWN